MPEPPSRPKGRRPPPAIQQALIFTREGVLNLAEPFREGRSGKAEWIAAEEILKIRLTLILLYGRLEIWGAHAGQPLKTELEYNTVAHHLLAPALRGLIRKTWQQNAAAKSRPARETTLNGFESVSYSFYNGLRLEALQPEERLLGLIYQPEIRAPRLRFFHRKVAPRTALAITDQQLILLQEDLAYRTHHEWIFTFCPRHRVSYLKQTPMESWQRVSFHLRPESVHQSVDITLESEKAQHLVSLWAEAFEEQTSGGV